MGMAALALTAPGFGQGAEWRLEPSSVSIGEPCRMRLTIEHDADDSVISPPTDFEVEGLAIRVLSGPTVSTVPSEEFGRSRTELVWTVMGIEPGTLIAPRLEIALATEAPLEWSGEASLTVAGELGPDEDEPRPLPRPEGFDGAASAGDSSAWWLSLLAAVLGGGLLFAWRRNRAGQVQAAVAAALEEPAAILTRLLGDGASSSPREVGYGVALALRGATEKVSGRAGAGLALGEWLAAQADGTELLDEHSLQLGFLLERAETLKFGPAEGRLSQRELLSSAQDLVHALERRKQELRS
ncbi:MAG: LPXTG-motif cell wall-anchored protein [Planctomycetota bacterium]|jgi:LPXTG-motif cell wall-anchored protein